jgi:predicted DNA binding protein
MSSKLEYPPPPETKSFQKKLSNWSSNGNILPDSTNQKSNSKLHIRKEPKLTADDTNIYSNEVDQESVTAMLKCLSKCMDKIEKEFETLNKTHIYGNNLAKKLSKLRTLLASSEYSDDNNKKPRSWLSQWRTKFKQLLSK